jgi:hypothetical protein
MGAIKWLVVFLAAFIVAWVLIFTFTQDPFKALVSARIFAYRTPPVPIYVYVAGAFGAGLLLGLGTLVYNYVLLKGQILRKGKQIQDLERDLEMVRAELENYQAEKQQSSDETGTGTVSEGENF